MVDAVIIDGKKYYQVADIRRDLGVTSLDYPLKKAKVETFLLRGTSGQLCRMLDEDGYEKLMKSRSSGAERTRSVKEIPPHHVSEPRVFTDDRFGNIRTLEEDGKILFCGVDVAKALGYSVPRKALFDHCKGVLKRNALTNGGAQEMSFILESDVYRLITHSKLQDADRFEHWVFEDVLPSIRKHGAYMTPETLENALLNPDFLIQLATKLKEEQTKNKMLMEQNANLNVTNKALTRNTRTWKSRAIVSALVRKVASKSGNNFQMAWNKFYKELQYKKSIYLNKREGNGHMIDKVKEDEWPDLIEVATAMCEALGINAAEVINEVNAAH